jgi:hypothetical protein
VANRWFSPVDALGKAVVLLEGNCVIASGVSGKTQSLKGSGIKAVTNVATGMYKVQLVDAFNRFLACGAGFVSSLSATTTALASASPGAVVVITVLGNATAANWVAAGVPASVTPAVGVAFVASAGIGSVTGTTAKVGLPADSGIASVEIVGNANLTINNAADPHFFIMCLAATSSSDTTLIPADPVDGCVLGFSLMLRNSSVKGAGEV